MRKLLLLVVAALALLGASGCATLLESIGKPEVRSVSPRIAGLDFNAVDLVFDVGVYNPYPIPIVGPRLRYGLDVAGSTLVESDTPVSVDLPAGDVGTVALPVKLTYASVQNTAKTLADASEVPYKLRGAVLFSVMNRTFELPMSREGKFPMLRMPKFSDVKFNLSDISFTRARIGVEAAVENPNGFPLDLKGLGYALRVGETEVGGLTGSSGGNVEAKSKGRIALTGEVSAANAIAQLLKGSSVGKPTLAPTGSLVTPYGSVQLPQ